MAMRPGQSSRGNARGNARGGFVYQPRSADSVKKRAERTGGKFDSPFNDTVDTFRPKVGDNAVRILPPTWEGHDHYGLTIWVHAYVGAENSTYLCPLKMYGKPCPVCVAAKEAKDSGDVEEAKQLTVQEKIACYILDREADEPTIPLVWMLSWTMDRDIAAVSYNKRTGKVLYVDNPDIGYDLMFNRYGSGKTKTKYGGYAFDREPSSISDDDDSYKEIMAFVVDNPLPDILKCYDTDYLQKMLTGTVAETDEELDPEEPQTEEEQEQMEAEQHQRSHPPRRGAPAVRRQPEPEEEPQDEEPFDPDPPPARPVRPRPVGKPVAKPAPRKPVQQQEEEEWPEEEAVEGEEEIEEEAPPPARRPAPAPRPVARPTTAPRPVARPTGGGQPRVKR
jgi:hypothetical protein